jgi:hypothetical protein
MLGESRSVYTENIGNIFSFQIEKFIFGIKINSHDSLRSAAHAAHIL